MNTRTLPATAVAQDLDSELSAIHVDRAVTELKHGRTVVLDDDSTADALLLLAAVETLSPARLQRLQALNVPLRLLLTAERLQALAWPDASTARSLTLNGPWTVETLQALGAAGSGMVDLSGLTAQLQDLQAANGAMDAAVTLVKRTRLAPALLVAELPAARWPELQARQVLRLSTADVQRVHQGAHLQLRRVSDARVPIAAHEDCTLVLFRELNGDAEHVAVIVGQPDLSQPVPVRLHSSCLTGDLLGSLRCDCGDQLQAAVTRLAETGGVLLYLAQEGRGTGLASKLRAYRLQDGGLDTIDADRYLGFRSDERDFQAAVSMLQALGIGRIRLITNNPSKIDAMRRGGIEVVDRLPLIAPVNPHNARYIQTKRDRAGHLVREDEQD